MSEKGSLDDRDVAWHIDELEVGFRHVVAEKTAELTALVRKNRQWLCQYKKAICSETSPSSFANILRRVLTSASTDRPGSESPPGVNAGSGAKSLSIHDTNAPAHPTPPAVDSGSLESPPQPQEGPLPKNLANPTPTNNAGGSENKPSKQIRQKFEFRSLTPLRSQNTVNAPQIPGKSASQVNEKPLDRAEPEKTPAPCSKIPRLLSPSTNNVPAMASFNFNSKGCMQTPCKIPLPCVAAKNLLKATDVVMEVEVPVKQLCPTENLRSTVQELPEIPSDYSSEDEAAWAELKKNVPAWASTPALRFALREQAMHNPECIFGRVQPIDIDELFPGKKCLRPRSSSANWSSSDYANID